MIKQDHLQIIQVNSKDLHRYQSRRDEKERKRREKRTRREDKNRKREENRREREKRRRECIHLKYIC